MNVAAAVFDGYISREDYRRWRADQTRGRFERVDGQIVSMAAERVLHARVKAAVWLALRRAVEEAGIGCEALPDGVTVEVGESDYEPDALVNCGPEIAGDAISAPQPVIIVEVLSPGTASVDTGGKLVDYFRIPSVRHYLVVHPTRRVVIHYRRTVDGLQTEIVSSGDIAMNPPGLTISLADVFVRPGLASPK